MANTKITPHVLDSTLISGHSTVTAATNDFVLIQDVSDSNALKKALVSDLAQNEENPTFTGVVTANAGVVVDNITIDGTEIDLSSGDLTIDVAGEIRLSADDNGEIHLYDGGLHYGSLLEENSNLIIQSIVQDEDILFKGDDGGSVITALTLDMSKAGSATFNHDVILGDNGQAIFGAGDDLTIYHDGSDSYIKDTGTGNLLIQYSDLYFGDGTNHDVVFRDSGNIGIGTTNPQRLLHLQKTGSDAAVLRIDTNNQSHVAGIELMSGHGDWGIYNSDTVGDALEFRDESASATRMMINSAGTILGATTSAPNYPGTFTSARTGNSATTTQNTWGFNAYAGGNAIDFGIKTSGSGSYALGVINHGETTWMSRLDYSGAIHLTNTTVQNISDRRLKKDIVDANSQWNDIKALQFKNFKWKDEARGTDTYLGLIADEVESVSPGLVGIDAISAETMPEDGIDPEYKNVKYSIVWMKAVKALQEAMTKIETLETKVAELEG